MRMLSKFVALALAASLQPAMADPLVLDFEDLTTTGLLNGSYNGVDITGSAFGVRAQSCNGNFSFFRGAGNCGALLLSDDTAVDTTTPSVLTIALTGGFIDAVTFAYASKEDSLGLTVEVFSNSSNKALATLSGLDGEKCGLNYAFCNWSDANGTPTTISFSGTADYIRFTVAAGSNQGLLDDLRFTRATPTTNPLPEPGGVALAFAALGALGWTRRRTAR